MAGWLSRRKGTTVAAPASATGRLVTEGTASREEPESDGNAGQPAARLPDFTSPSSSTDIRFDDMDLPPLRPHADADGSLEPARPTTPPAATLTDAQIEDLVARVAERLADGVLGDELRDSVRRVVSETSERLVREEIARLRREAERD